MTGTPSEEVREEARRRFFVTLLSDFNDLIEEGRFNDVIITCSQGDIVKVPSLILASISPLFRSIGIDTSHPSTDYVTGIILPHLSLQDIQIFLKRLCNLWESSSPTTTLDNDIPESEIQSIQSVMDALCGEFQPPPPSETQNNNIFIVADENEWIIQKQQGETANRKKIGENKNPENLKRSRDIANISSGDVESTPKRKTGRKKGQRLKQTSEPYYKEEVIETPRTETVYGLRKIRKKKRFADEVGSDDEGVENDDENVPPVQADLSASDEDLSDYNPEEDDSDEDDINEDDDIDEEDEQNLDVETDGEQDEEDEEVIRHIDETEVETEEVMTMLTVNVREDGAVEIMDQVDDPMTLNESLSVSGIGKVINVMSSSDDTMPETSYRKIYADNSAATAAAAAADPRSLLKTQAAVQNSSSKKQLYLMCSICDETCLTLVELKHHCAKNHPGSKFFTIPTNNPHKNCVQCQVLMKSYEQMMAQDPGLLTKNVCFPCPHCRRRHMGHLGGFLNHLSNDHRHLIAKDYEGNDESYFYALRRPDDKVLICEFCDIDVANTKLLNQHLITCPANTSGNSAGLFCHICGKMFEQRNSLKQHLNRHGKDKMKRARNFFCRLCPVTCTSEQNLEKHIAKTHNEDDPDLNFVLHEGCDRCSILYNSYIENKKSTGDNSIAFRDMVFKCPHCCMLLYANFKHALRYIYNHVNKFHMDPDINDMTVPPNEADNGLTLFRLRSKQEPDIFTCEFCELQSMTRNDYNAHLSMCPSSTVACRPGYMCDTCGFITGTSRHLRDHISTHVISYECSICKFTTKTERSLRNHLKSVHTEEGIRKRKEANYIPCSTCGKMRKEGASMKNHAKKCGMGPTKISCTECDMDFKHTEDMQAHALIHYGQVTCPIHNILFKNENEIYHHVNTANPDEKYPNLKCCMCEKTFRHMCIFMNHLRRHLRISPYRCDVCQKNVQSYASLQLHYKRTHSEAQTGTPFKSFVCEYCTKVFGTKGHLKEHIAGVHERYNNVNCPVCHKSFNTQKRMKKHLFNTHKDMADQFRSHAKVEAYAGLSVKI